MISTRAIRALGLLGLASVALALPAVCFAAVAPPDQTPPETSIDSHPRSLTKAHHATFEFSSSEPGSTFLCSYDGLPYASCTSPFTTPRLKPGKHRFDVLATDAAGNRDQTAATFFWKVRRDDKKHKHHGHHR
jgi:hypothetical protein